MQLRPFMSEDTPSLHKPRTRRLQKHAEVTSGKLIEAARRIFSEIGFDAIYVRDIENNAGVKRGLLAYHFTDKKLFYEAHCR